MSSQPLNRPYVNSLEIHYIVRLAITLIIMSTILYAYVIVKCSSIRLDIILTDLNYDVRKFNVISILYSYCLNESK